MSHAPALIVIIALPFVISGCLSWAEGNSTNAGLPLVHVAAPTHGFVCVPVIPPRIVKRGGIA